MSCVHMATLGFLATSLTQNIWIINAWLTTLRMGVHGRTNFTDKIHQIQIQIFQCGILQLLFASNIKTQVFLKVCCPQGFSRMIAE